MQFSVAIPGCMISTCLGMVRRNSQRSQSLLQRVVQGNRMTYTHTTLLLLPGLLQLENLNQLSSLTRLDASWNQLTALPSLSGLSLLRDLVLHNNNM